MDTPSSPSPLPLPSPLPPPFGDLTKAGDDELELQICSFASRIAAAMCLFLLAVAEYDHRVGESRLRPAVAVTHRPWDRPGAARPDRETAARIERHD